MLAETIVLRLIHVLGGIFWVGAMAYNTFFLVPAFAAAGPQATGGITKVLRERHLFTVLPTVAILVMLSGVRLMQLTSSNFAAEWFRSPSGLTYTIGGVAAILGFLVGMFVGRPAMMRMSAMLAERATAPADRHAALDATIGALRARTSVANGVVSVLLTGSAATMAVARYL